MITIIPIVATLVLLIVPDASLWCDTRGPACYSSETNLIVMDERIKPKYIPWVFLHEFGHYLGKDEQGANEWAKQFKGVVIPKTIEELTI